MWKDLKAKKCCVQKERFTEDLKTHAIVFYIKADTQSEYIFKGGIVAEAYTTQPNSKASSRVLYNIFESTCGG